MTLPIALPGPLVTIGYFLIALFPLVMAHEIGHFLLAKLNRIRVDEFGIGFPPRVVRLARRGETDYTLNLLPLGGFVRMAGEDDPDVPGAFASRSKSARTAVLVAGPLANFALATAIFSGMALAGEVPALVGGVDGVAVSRVTPGSPAEQGGLLAGDVIVATDGEPLVDVADRPEDADAADAAIASLTKRADEAAGRAMTLTVLRGRLLTVPASSAPAAGTAPSDLPGVRGTVVTSAPPSARYGVGDVVLRLAETAGPGAADDAVLLRDARVVTLEVTPRRSAPGQPGRMGVEITAPSVPARFGVVGALVRGVWLTVRALRYMLTALGGMVVGSAEVELKGPVGISIMSREVGEQGLPALLQFMALLSLNLGLINLLPVPALDGGRLLFIAAEALRGRRVEPSREAVVHLIGFVVVIGLMAVLTAVEVARLTGVVGP